MHVVLVHGWLNTGGIMRGLARALAAQGHICHSPSLKPCTGRVGNACLAQQLSEYIDNHVPKDERVALVGFSMGSLVCRYYLQEMSGRERAAAFFAISGPHAGTLHAYLLPFEGVREMRPNSAFLQSLRRTEERLNGLPVTSYWTPYDMMIRPIRSCQWPRGEVVRIPSVLHALMPYHPMLQADIARRLAQLVQPQTTTG